MTARGGLPCRRACDRDSLLAAFRLVYQSYFRKGLAQPNRLRLRIIPHQLLDTSSVLLALRGERVAGTLTLVEDGELGLPMESLYRSEVAQLRRKGHRLAELTCFAVDPSETRRFGALRGLLSAALRRAARRSIDVLGVCIHPDHAPFYERRLEFRRLGPQRYCPWVCNKPTIAMVRRLAGGAVRSTGVDWPGMYGTEEGPHKLSRPCREYFLRLLDETCPPAQPKRQAA